VEAEGDEPVREQGRAAFDSSPHSLHKNPRSKTSNPTEKIKQRRWGIEEGGGRRGGEGWATNLCGIQREDGHEPVQQWG